MIARDSGASRAIIGWNCPTEVLMSEPIPVEELRPIAIGSIQAREPVGRVAGGSMFSGREAGW